VEPDECSRKLKEKLVATTITRERERKKIALSLSLSLSLSVISFYENTEQ